MNSAIISLITYVLASIFSIAGMGAAGVLIPNYVTLGIAFYPAILAGLLQNSFALSVATANNFRANSINLKLGIAILIPALIMVPLGAYTNIHVPKILDFSVFAAFLIFAIYRLTSMRGKVSELKGLKGIVLAILLGITAGYMGGLLGIDGSPFAIIALSYIEPEPKKISGTTGLVAFAISLAGLFSYMSLLHIDSIPMWPALIVAGALGGLTGSYLMHRIKPVYVRFAIIALISVALAEVILHIVPLI